MLWISWLSKVSFFRRITFIKASMNCLESCVVFATWTGGGFLQFAKRKDLDGFSQASGILASSMVSWLSTRINSSFSLFFPTRVKFLGFEIEFIQVDMYTTYLLPLVTLFFSLFIISCILYLVCDSL